MEAWYLFSEQAASILSPSVLLQCLYSCSNEGNIYLIISSAGCWCTETTVVLDFSMASSLERHLGSISYPGQFIHNTAWEEPWKDGRGVVYCSLIT